MWELLKIEEQEQFKDRVFPIVLSDAGITDGISRLGYAKYWKARLEELEKAMAGVGPFSISTATVEEGKRIRAFADKVDQIASMVADMSFRAVDDLNDEALRSISRSLASRFRELKLGGTCL